MDKPVILFEGTYTMHDVEKLRKTKRIWRENDLFLGQIAELYEATYPSPVDRPLKEAFIVGKAAVYNSNGGNWIYFPWNGHLIHTIKEDDYFFLRTFRNRYLVSEKEQDLLAKAHVGFLGLSIGAHFALSMAYSGIGNTYSLAEHDRLDTTNLNRLPAALWDVGRDKLEIMSENLYSINPYVALRTFSKGMTEKLLVEFFASDAKPDIVFEAVDDFKMKILLRVAARQARVPVVMLTNLGDSMLIDIERFDIDAHLPLFNGAIGDVPERILQSEVSELDKVKRAMEIVGIEHLSSRILKTLSHIGKTVTGRPQLYSTVSMGGGIATLLAREILLGHEVPSGRKKISFDKLLGLTDNDDQEERAEAMALLLPLLKD